MSTHREHPYLETLRDLLAERRCDRREFLRTAALLGASAASAYAFADRVLGPEAGVAHAQAAPRRGGSLRIAARVREIPSPHAMSNVPASNTARQTVEYLAWTGYDNVTRPMLLEKWTPSEDLKTWTLHVRRNVKWRKGRAFTADDVIWNIRNVLDPKTGSSVLGLMKAYILEDFDTGEKDAQGRPRMSSRLWDSRAIEKVDDFTVRLNLKVPQLAVPEHFFHYPFVILDPEEGNSFKVGMNGTGAFDLVEYDVGKRATYRPNRNYWGAGPFLDELVFVDLGDDANADLAAYASRQVQAIASTHQAQFTAIKRLPNTDIHFARTGATVHARMQPVPPFTDMRIIRAMRLAVDNDKVAEVTFGELGYRAEHHHVSPVHPECAPMPPFKRDIAAAKRLLAEAGHPNGIDIPMPMAVSSGWQKDIAVAVVDQWAEAGIRVKIEALPSTEWNKVWNKAPFAFGDWSHRPLGVMCLALAYRTGVPWNESLFSNKEFDEVLAIAESTADVEKRRAHMLRLQTILQNDGPLVQPLFRNVFMPVDRKIKGVQMHPTQYINCNDWWMDA
ncbi:MAG: ABC transporter substrate-binding protein [Alphaproteobacteria bacterium]|nr:ABC transporter substrate-binding protein [Alphaproteobacteria bacterium]